MSAKRKKSGEGRAIEASIHGLSDDNDLSKYFAVTDEEMQIILQKRARRLAYSAAEPVHGNTIEVIEFQLGNQRYGIASSFVKEVLPLPSLTPIPCTPPFVLGVTLLRTRLISVVDLRHFLKLDHHSLSDLNQLMILKYKNLDLGVLTDAIDEVREIPVKEIMPPPSYGGEGVSPYLLGVHSAGFSILDGERLLADPQMIICETVI